jgi:arsenate reductase
MPIVVFGIPNCDSVKKALRSLSNAGLEHTFHDFKKQGLDNSLLETWFAQVGWEALLNRKGSTWRQLSDAEKALAVDAKGVSHLMLLKPTLIKRPVVVRKGRVTVGQMDFTA